MLSTINVIKCQFFNKIFTGIRFDEPLLKTILKKIKLYNYDTSKSKQPNCKNVRWFGK
jgi:hypothetical protein